MSTVRVIDGVELEHMRFFASYVYTDDTVPHKAQKCK